MSAPDPVTPPAGTEANPFWSPDLFVGRHLDVRDLEALLREGRSVRLVGGRRAGKTTVQNRISESQIQRRLVRADVSGWNLSSEPASLGLLRDAIERLPLGTYGEATQQDIRVALLSAAPVALIIDEADRILKAPWGPSFYYLLRALDDAEMKTDLSILLIGGPILMSYRDQADKGSPPLNTADVRYINPLDRAAILELAQLANRAGDCDEIMLRCGGHAWLTNQLLAAMWAGRPLEDAYDDTFAATFSTYGVWAQQLGEAGRDLLRRLPRKGGIPWSDFRDGSWARYREAAVFGQCVGAIRRENDHVRRGPRIFTDWFARDHPSEFTWDIALSYATQDVADASRVLAELRQSSQCTVYYAEEQEAALYETDTDNLVPNTYGVRSKRVLVLSTPRYVAEHWEAAAYQQAADKDPGRILFLERGVLPLNLPEGAACRGVADVTNALAGTPAPPREAVGKKAADRRILALAASTSPSAGPEVSHAADLKATLVMIHGFWSSPDTWDRLLRVWSADERLRGLRITSFGYSSPKQPRSRFSTTRIPGYEEVAETLGNYYRVTVKDEENIAFVTHSQGGLILQRFLAWMVDKGRADELSRIRSVVMLACPNNGSEYLRSLRRFFGFSRHPQARELKPLAEDVTKTQQIVLDHIVNAKQNAPDTRYCHIPFHVYAGDSDNIVKKESAQGRFPGATTIPGSHATILDPSSRYSQTAEVVRDDLIGDIAALREDPSAAR